MRCATMIVAMLSLSAGCATRRPSSGRPPSTGERHRTHRALDLAIDGEGYFVVKTPAGGYLFTRNGELKVSATGQMLNADDFALYPECVVPQGRVR